MICKECLDKNELGALRAEVERLKQERDAADREFAAFIRSSVDPAFTKMKRLQSTSAALLDRIEKFIDRRCVDDGPDWEYSKLDAAMTEMRAALKEQR